MIVGMTDSMEKQDFLKRLSFLTNKRKGNDPFSLNELFNDAGLITKFQDEVDTLIKTGFFFLEKTLEDKYVKTYRIPEVCERTIKELQKENINPFVMQVIERNPLVLHMEFSRWVNTKHKSMLSFILDKYWHNFILYSYEYNSWCHDTVGYLVYHVPTPYYEKNEFAEENIILDNIEYFSEYVKNYEISETISLYNLPHKMLQQDIKIETIKNIFLDLISDVEPNKMALSIGKKEISNLLDEINHNLKIKGYYIIDSSKIDLEVYHHLNNQLGTIFNRTNITINTKSDKKYNSPKAMPLHTDIYEVDIVSWFCQKQDLHHGSIILKDLSAYKEKFNQNEIKILESIQIRYPIYKRIYTGEHPLLKEGNIYYSPWLEKKNYTNEQEKTLNKFKIFINNQEEIIIKLKDGDALFIDNSRMLHGRQAFSEDSKRLLYRTHVILSND